MNIMDILKRPFPPSSISWRAGATNAKKNGGKPSKCIALAYIDARDVMERLDYVFGNDWECTYSHADKKTICNITIILPDGKKITRANGAGDSDIEAEKGAITCAFKRAAVMFGIGRYLYNIPNTWVECDEWGHIQKPPELPDWALPETEFKSVAMKIMGLAKEDKIKEVLTEISDLDKQGKLILWNLIDKETQDKIRKAQK